MQGSFQVQSIEGVVTAGIIDFFWLAGQWARSSREAESGGLGRQREAEQDRGNWGPAEGSHQDQSVPERSGERHQCPCGFQKRAHSIQGLQAHTTAAGMPTQDPMCPVLCLRTQPCTAQEPCIIFVVTCYFFVVTCYYMCYIVTFT